MIIMSPSTGGNAHKVNKAVVIDHMEPARWLIIQTSRGISTPMIKKIINLHTIRGVCLYDLHCSLLSEIEEADRAIATTKGSKVRLVRVAVQATQTNVLTRTVCVSVCVWGVVALLECVLTRDPVIITLACAVGNSKGKIYEERERGGREREGEGEREHKQPLSKKNACSYITFQTCT